jgi:hypothetical protein
MQKENWYGGLMTETKTLPRKWGFWGTALLPVNGLIESDVVALPAVVFAVVFVA